MPIESFTFYRGINRNKPKVLLEESELYTCEGFDLEYLGMLMAREPKNQGLFVDGPLLDHPQIEGPPPPLPPVTPPAPWALPNLNAVWGWFKHNEGAGTTIIDYSSVAVNAGLETAFGDPTTKFWSVTGFGHNDNTGYYTWMRRTTAGARDTDYVSMVGFIRPINYGEFVFRGAMQLGEGGTANWLRIGWRDATTRNWAVRSGNLSSVRYSTATFSFNTWYCLFAYASSEMGVQKVRLYVRSSGNPFSLVIDEPYDYNIKGTQIGLYGFGSNNGNYIMDGGDMIYYAYPTSEGVITLAQADDIYENLKSRYGMT